MRYILSALIYTLWASAACAVAPSYSDTATTRIARSSNNALISQDSHTDTVPVSATVSDTEGGTTAKSDASAGFNDLHVRASTVGTNSSSTQLTTTAIAQWNDHLFFRRGGQNITSGNIAMTVHAKGSIDIEPPMISPWFSFNVGLGGGATGIGAGINGAYDQLYNLPAQSVTWNATDGLPMTFALAALVGNTTTTLSAVVDFSAGAQITSIALLDSHGLPDPTVTITSASGIVYGVPEPEVFPLLLCALGLVQLRRVRPR
jgi:hypothetical protein